MDSPPTVKVVLLGESGVGKTCIISQFIQGDFNPDTVTSLSAQFISKTLEFNDLNKQIKYDIWDTAGQERFRALAKIFYKDAKVICLCYDITNKKSFKELKDFWYEQQVKLNVDGEPIFAVVAHKNDLYEYQQVSDEEAKEFAKSINAHFYLTSAKKNILITDLFIQSGKRFLDPNYNKETNSDKKETDKNEINKNENDTNENKDDKDYERKVRANSVRIKEVSKQEKNACC